MNHILRTRTARLQRKIYIAVDLAKAFDSVDRKKLFKFLEDRVETDCDRVLINLIKSLYTNQTIKIGNNTFTATKGT